MKIFVDGVRTQSFPVSRLQLRYCKQQNILGILYQYICTIQVLLFPVYQCHIHYEIYALSLSKYKHKHSTVYELPLNVSLQIIHHHHPTAATPTLLYH